MGDEKPEKGDQVSWKWGGGAPEGTVAETKDHGAIEIKSKRGNTIKKKADPGNPAVHIERSGNDVVKRASELTVEIKSSGKGGKGGNGQGEKRKAKDQDPEIVEDSVGDDEVGEGKDGYDVEGIESDGDDKGPHTMNEQGKEVKKGGKEANKKQKREEDEHEVDGIHDSIDEAEVDISSASEEDEEDEAAANNTDEEDAEVDDDEVVEIVDPAVDQAQKPRESNNTARNNSSQKADGQSKKDVAPQQQGGRISTRTRTKVTA
ncbi:hypothetical protein F4820DRAFT_464504 [Hypoxylon rubiginosum]|uniref:Uncharacterized protein n=1 Tax=Hypoxylon rubiginosum TaxID=110542 RepID=A0ACB9YR86_9PEZI|nr:hypothetical protein F4820DRAFT_464504 [Hypoxylon rubiginosum]